MQFEVFWEVLNWGWGVGVNVIYLCLWCFFMFPYTCTGNYQLGRCRMTQLHEVVLIGTPLVCETFVYLNPSLCCTCVSLYMLYDFIVYTEHILSDYSAVKIGSIHFQSFI